MATGRRGGWQRRCRCRRYDGCSIVIGDEVACMRRILTIGLSVASLACAAMASAQSPPPDPQPVPNRAPTITVTCEPCTVDVGQTAQITATAIDPDGDELVYHWIAPAGTLADAN